MALARLVYEYANPAQGPPEADGEMQLKLLDPVLALLRSPSREVVKSTLGYVKVSIVRLDLVQLEGVLPRLLEGLLLWSEDSKNRFRMKVRVIVERLARKLGLEKVAQHIPEAHTKLITHIRKTNNRTERRREGYAPSGGGRTVKSHATARTKADAPWDEDAFFGDDGDGATTARMTERTGRTGRTDFTARNGGVRARSRIPIAGDGTAEPVDLLDGAGRASRGKAARDALKQRTRPEDAFPTSRDGRLIVREERDGKRRRDDSEDDSDGGSDGGRTARTARTTRTSNTRRTSRTELSRGAKSLGGRSEGGRGKGKITSKVL